MKTFTGIKAFTERNFLFQNKAGKCMTVPSKSLALGIAEDLRISMTSRV